MILFKPGNSNWMVFTSFSMTELRTVVKSLMATIMSVDTDKMKSTSVNSVIQEEL